MYPLMGALTVLLGALLFALAGAAGKKSRGAALALRAAGVLLTITGLTALFLLLTGRLTLPLSRG